MVGMFRISVRVTSFCTKQQFCLLNNPRINAFYFLTRQAYFKQFFFYNTKMLHLAQNIDHLHPSLFGRLKL